MKIGDIELRPHQVKHIEKFDHVPACLVGDDKRAGKTIVALVLTLRRLERDSTDRPILIVSDKTSQWTRDFGQLGIPDHKLHLVDRPARKKFTELLKDPRPGHFYQIHWAGLRPAFANLASIRWHTIIADEAHAAKNRKSQRTKALKGLRAQFKIGMTADLVDDSPQDAWSLLHWLYPAKYPSFWSWVEKRVEFSTRDGAHGSYRVFGKPINLDEFHREIEPFYVRVTLQEIDPGQVPHEYEEHYVDMTPPQREAYEQMLDLQMMQLGDNTTMCEYPMVAAMRLQQLAQAMGIAETRQVWREVTEDDPNTGERRKVRQKVNTTSIRQVEPSPKLDDVIATLLSTESPCGPTVIFSQFPGMIRMACRRMDKAKLKYVAVTDSSQVTDAERAFQRGDVDILIGSIWIISESIELSRLETEIFIDCPWNPRVRGQAIARGQKVGRREPIRIIDIRTRNSVDLIRLDRARTKQAWKDAMMGIPAVTADQDAAPDWLDVDLV